MNKSKKTFRDKLLNLEKTNESYKENYERKVEIMINRKLSKCGKWALMLSCLVASGFVLYLAGFALLLPIHDYPIQLRVTLAAAIASGLGWVIFAVVILKKGLINLKIHLPIMAIVGWVFVLSIITTLSEFRILKRTLISRWHSFAPIEPTKIIVLLAAGLVIILICNYINRFKLKMREKLLEIEYRIAELSEKIEAKSDE